MVSWRRGQAYSQDLRERVLAVDGLSARQAADRFGVSVSYVVKARQRRDRHGLLTPGAQRSWTPRKIGAHHAAIAAHVREHQDATLAELCMGRGGVWHIGEHCDDVDHAAPCRVDAQKSAWKRANEPAPISPRRVVSGANCKPS